MMERKRQQKGKSMIIGLTGQNGSGKGVAADYLVERKGFMYYSLSDAIREEILKHDKVITREKLIVAANTLRNTFGPAILAERILKKIDRSRKTVVDSFRNPEEVRVFRTAGDFELWCIAASPKTRFARIKTRNREQDPRTLEEFIRLDEKELVSDDPASQNLHACRAMAEVHISNDGTLQELHASVEKILKERNT